MSAVDPAVARSYELEANNALGDARWQLASGQRTGPALVVHVRDELAALRQKLVQQLLDVSLHLTTFNELDAKHKVTVFRPTESHPVLDAAMIAEIIAGVDQQKTEKGALPNEIVGMIGEFVADAEFQRVGATLTESLTSNDNLEAVRQNRNLANTTVLQAAEDILAGRAPHIDPKLKEKLKELQMVSGLSRVFEHADQAQLDGIITFLLDYCPNLSSLRFIQTFGLSVEVMFKLGRFACLESLYFRGRPYDRATGQFSNDMFKALATSVQSLKKLSISKCSSFSLAAFAERDEKGVAYATHMKQLTSFVYTPATSSPIPEAVVHTMTQELPELEEFAIDQSGIANYRGGITDQSVNHIAHNLKKLRSLRLRGCYNGLTDAAFAAPDAQGKTNAEHLKGLVELDISSGGLGDRALHAVATHMTQLTTLVCPMHCTVSSHSVAAMVRNLKSLTSLNLENCTLAKNDMVILLEGLSKVVSLSLMGFAGDIYASGIFAAITPYFPRLTHLDLSYCRGLVDDAFTTQDRSGVTAIERMKGLQSLNLRDTAVKDATALAIVKHMKQLTSLNLVNHNAFTPAVKQKLELYFPFAVMEQRHDPHAVDE